MNERNPVYRNMAGWMILLLLTGNSCWHKGEKQDRISTNLPEKNLPHNQESAPSVSRKRDTVKNYPVAAYSVKTDNPLNDWYFRVRIFETAQTFEYLMKLEFEEIRGVDTLRVPDLGIPPLVQIQKGSETYSCIVGFLDKEGHFREYKKIYVQNDKLKITVLRHYAVSRYNKKIIQ